jgi:hypothetical protein
VARTASPTAQLTELEAGFGTGRVVVRSYEAAASIGADFVEAAGLEWSDAFAEPRRVNTSLDPVASILVAALEHEYGLSGLHVAADRLGPAPKLPGARTRQLQGYLPIIQAVDVSHPLLAPFRDGMMEIRWPDPSEQTPFDQYVAYLGRLLAAVADIQAAQVRARNEKAGSVATAPP